MKLVLVLLGIVVAVVAAILSGDTTVMLLAAGIALVGISTVVPA